MQPDTGTQDVHGKDKQRPTEKEKRKSKFLALCTLF
jgi:hypothetical protein